LEAARLGHEQGQHQVMFLISAIGKKKNKHQWIDQLIGNDKMLQLMMALLRTLTPMGEIKISHEMNGSLQFFVSYTKCANYRELELHSRPEN
jgi:hypothetical protein